MTAYYDLILGLIPLALFGIAGGFYANGAAVSTAISAGGLVTLGLIGHAMFVRAPVEPLPLYKAD